MKKDSKTDSLLVEIRCEELPPAVLWNLADSFPDSLLRELQAEGFADSDSRRAKGERGDKKLATPRRFAALLQNIRDESPPREFFRRGPKLSACKDKDGRPTKALVGFMQSVGATCENDLEHAEEKGNQYVAWRGKTPGRFLADCLSALVEKVLLSLPAPRRMRWGDNDFKFIRPIRGLLMQHGKKTLRGNVMSVPAFAHTVGHPILSSGKIKIPSADNYESILRDSGKVQVDLDSRLEIIRKELDEKKLGVSHAMLLDDPEAVESNTRVIPGPTNRASKEGPLLREVAAMCEWPICHWRKVDEIFMSLPQECVIECMKKHQKFFPFIGGNDQVVDKLLRDYCLVADGEPKDAEAMLRDYDSVLRARLRDVQFYFAEDKKVPLADYVERLKTIAFHQKLGSQHDRIARVCKIAAAIAPLAGIKAKPADIKQTAEKILAPLPTLMCGEYPELQEYLSTEYFGKDKIFPFVCLCYELEKLAAMFGVGEIPTGSKDPRGLRRDAMKVAFAFAPPDDMNVASAFVHIDVDVRDIIAAAVESFDGTVADARNEIYDFVLDRLRFLLSRHYPLIYVVPPATKATIESVVSQKPRCFYQARLKVEAVQKLMNEFTAAAQILIAADKRIKNIFRKSGKDAEVFGAPDPALFAEDAERELWKTAQTLRTEMDAHLQANKFAEALQSLTAAAAPLEKFFNEVMVNADDKKIRANRFALLAQFSVLLNCVADLSFLSSESGG